METPVDIGMINAGGLRADLEPGSDGTITYKQSYDVMPFSNELGYVTIKGSDVKDALEEQWKTNLNSQNSRPPAQAWPVEECSVHLRCLEALRRAHYLAAGQWCTH